MPDHESEPPVSDPSSVEPGVNVHTHLGLNPALCGEVVACGPGVATVVLSTSPVMVADAEGLVHGGFVFGAADHAAMVAVNDPNVVLGAAESRFTAPVRVGATVVCEARVTGEKGRKRSVNVRCLVGEDAVMEGVFTAFVLDAHVLSQG